MQNENASTSPNTLRQENSLPFFTRFLEGQHSDGDNPPTGEGLMQASSQDNQSLLMSLKYPSDRDEIDLY
jgi:hypothetical protein